MPFFFVIFSSPVNKKKKKKKNPKLLVRCEEDMNNAQQKGSADKIEDVEKELGEMLKKEKQERRNCLRMMRENLMVLIFCFCFCFVVVFVFVHFLLFLGGRKGRRSW